MVHPVYSIALAIVLVIPDKSKPFTAKDAIKYFFEGNVSH